MAEAKINHSSNSPTPMQDHGTGNTKIKIGFSLQEMTTTHLLHHDV